MKPSLSIITPVKNAAPWLVDCIKSGISQSFTDWEWIFIDDHSTDDSYKMVSAFADMDVRIQIHANPEKGIIGALKKGLLEARGHYITRMDADDVMPEGRLEKMVKALDESPPQTIVTGKVEYFSETEVSEGYRKYERWLNGLQTTEDLYTNIYRECVVASPNWMMRTEELRAVGGFSGLIYPEDYNLVFRWYRNHFKFKVLPEVTLHWREHPQRTSRNSENYGQRKFFELKLKRFLELDYNNSKPLVLWGTGIKARLTADLLDANPIDFTWMDLKPNLFPSGIANHPVVDYREIEKLDSPTLLLAIYPAKAEMVKLQQYLSRLNLEIGKDYWFL